MCSKIEGVSAAFQAGGTVPLEGSGGAPLLMKAASKLTLPTKPPSRDVAPEQLQKFLFPESLEHPEAFLPGAIKRNSK